MSRFITELEIKCCSTDEGLWEIHEPLVYESDLVGLVTIPKGFFTDLASVPRVPIIYESWGNRAHRSAVLHDYAYRIDSKPQFTYRQANAVFREAMESTGAGAKIRWPMWFGVFLGGWTSYHKKKVDWHPGDEPPVCGDVIKIEA